jgi:predicted ATPase
MSIQKIKASNFKNFRVLDLELSSFNVLIGANSSGKSNAIKIFQFLRDALQDSLDNAISKQGGVEFFRNICIGKEEPFTIELFSDAEAVLKSTEDQSSKINLVVKNTHYGFSLKFVDGPNFSIDSESLDQEWIFNADNGSLENSSLISTKEIFRIRRKSKEISIYFDDSEKISAQESEPVDHRILDDEQLSAISKKLLLPTILIPMGSKMKVSFLDLIQYENVLSNISLYNFDPKLSKRAVPVAGSIHLEEDGANLALVVKRILEDSENKRQFINYIRELLPFIQDFNASNWDDKSLFINLKESYFKDTLIPASFESDGTIQLIALIIALYFDPNQIIIIEEPERNIHPQLISKIVEMMKDASTHKQIIITSHNPEIIKYAGINNLILISRDSDGFSTASKPENSREVKIFLENEMGVDQLFIQNLLD